ncbi:tRNA lysidine(34) synthetase TilS [Motiliproteus coralliicola]|uniref:tRNA(Ile)-lysidine synthase n=1 Tax=Motiliproteus coralliicola TaxID=2283196 RepID=A0A369WL33_9GAMM|nr:tRNA lysidine(34) synthetase TilS [Motiliproteus coralliicola]RDE22337.1 tRNA lysidine(34) synthetase TilS [Motiliproteus coralliicola]
MRLSPETLLQSLQAETELHSELPVWIAYSGGMDSHVLLQLAVEAGLSRSVRLGAVHVHHGLQPEADGWAEHCESVCASLGVDFRRYDAGLAAGAGLENRAREARYRIFTELMADGGLLLQAHHADDQAETLLFRLLRAGGVRGLAGIPASRALGQGMLLRPLLGLTREQLRQYALDLGLSWIEDPSNQDLVHNRNYLRARVLPALQQRWPDLANAFGKSASHCRDALLLSQDLARIDLEACRLSGGGLAIDQLKGLAEHRRWNLLRHWLHQQELNPNEQQLHQLWRDLVCAREDAQPRFEFARVSIRRYRKGLYLIETQRDLGQEATDWSQPVTLNSGHVTELLLPFGQLKLEPVVGLGLRIPDQAHVTIRPRQGGERIRLAGRDGSRSLKKLLQQAAVPPWLREKMPLVYVDEELAAVADLWISADFEAGASQPGWRLKWDSTTGLEKGPI